MESCFSHTCKLVCTEARTCRRSAEAQGHSSWKLSQPTCVYPRTDAHKEPLVFPCRRQMNAGVFFHMLSARVPFLTFWCIQLHCQFISLLTQQSLISPCGSYTAQHMIALRGDGEGEGLLRKGPVIRQEELRENIRAQEFTQLSASKGG